MWCPVASSFAIRLMASSFNQTTRQPTNLKLRRARRFAAIRVTGQFFVPVAGMRLSPKSSSTLPATASLVLRAVTRSRPVARPRRRGRISHLQNCCLSSSKVSHRCTSSLPFRFETGIGLFAKRQPRPFPPPFLSPPSGSFSDPLSTHDRSRDRGAVVDGELIRGRTNGDDAVYESDYLICANDGVGAWATRPRGHAGYGPIILPCLAANNHAVLTFE